MEEMLPDPSIVDGSDPRLVRVRRFVLTHYREPIPLARAAQIARMERTSFSNYFHQKTGVCFRDWLVAVRVSEAMRLIAAEDLPLRELPALCGFNNVRALQRAFLRVLDATAIDYKTSIAR